MVGPSRNRLELSVFRDPSKGLIASVHILYPLCDVLTLDDS